MKVYTKLREMLSTKKDILLQMQRIEKKLTAHNEDIKTIFLLLKKLINPTQQPGKRIGFKPES